MVVVVVVVCGRVRRFASSLSKRSPHYTTPQANPGSFSAHGYEVLPLLQSLLGANNFSASHYAAAAVIFFASTPGHVEPLPEQWAPAAAAALNAGKSAAGLGVDSPAASAVVKVRGWGGGGGRVDENHCCQGTDQWCPPPPPPSPSGPHHRRPVWRHAPPAPLPRRRGGRAPDVPPRARAAAGAAAAVLERVIVLGESVPAAVEAAAGCEALSEAGRAMLRAGLERARSGERAAEPEPPHPHGASAEHTLATALDVVLTHPADFKAGVRASIKTGGAASAPRAHLVGAWLAAAAGDGDSDRAPPSDWRSSATKALSVDAMVHLLLHQRGQSVPVAMPGQEVDGAEEVGRV